LKKTILIRNSISGLIQVILTALLAFASVPIFINHLGIELYGIFALLGIVGNLNSLANFGLNGALIVYISKQGKGIQSNNDIIATTIFMTFVIISVASLALFFKQFILNSIFAIPENYFKEASKLFILLVFSNSILLLGQTATAVLDACQKIFINNMSQFMYSFLYWGGIILVVLSGGSLHQIGIIILFSAIIWFLVVSFFAYKVWGRINLKDSISNFIPSIKKQISYGSKIYLSGLISFLFEPLSKVLLSNYVDLRAVGLFEIAYKIKSQTNSLVAKSLYPLFPFIAANSPSKDFKLKLYDLSKKIQLFVVFLSGIFLFCMPYIMESWLGNNNSNEATIFVIVMTITMLLFSPSKIPIYQYLLANNLASRTFYIQLTSVLINIITFFVFLRYTGAFSILISNSLAFFGSFLLCNYYQIKFFEIKLTNVIIDEIIMLLLFVTNSLFGVIIFRMKSISLSDLFIFPILSYIILIIFVRIFKIFSKHESNYYFGSLGKVEPLIRKILWIRD